MQAPILHALAVDDDPAILSLMQVFLRARGYRVSSAVDGEQALQIAREQQVDLAIIDWNMPRMDGISLCKALRQLQSTHYIYVVMLTAKSDAAALQQAMEAGVDDFLNKPFRPSDLGARLLAAQRVLTLHADLAERNQSLQLAYDQLSRELELAREMQLRLLPPPSCVDRICFDWYFQASHYVGGDVFHYFPVDESRVCFYLIDVAGHGVPAALLAFHAQHQILSSRSQIARAIVQCRGQLDAACSAVVSEINRRFFELEQEDAYFTMLFGLIDGSRRQLSLVQAGHPGPLLQEAGSDTLRELGEGGLPIGILPDATYESISLELPSGSRLFLCSDGVTDCLNAEGERYGQARLQALLQARRDATLPNLRLALAQALVDWRGSTPVADDMSFLALEYA